MESIIGKISDIFKNLSFLVLPYWIKYYLPNSPTENTRENEGVRNPQICLRMPVK